MSITDAFARVAADQLIEFADSPLLSFARAENGKGNPVRIAKNGNDTVERRLGSDSLTIRSAAGRTVALFSIGADGRPTVDAGGGPAQLSDDGSGREARLLGALRGILAATQPGGPRATRVAEDVRAPDEVYREADGSTWHLLSTRESRDADRRAHGHALAMDDTVADEEYLLDDDAMVVLRSKDGSHIATAVVCAVDLREVHPESAYSRDWMGPDAMSMRLAYSSDIFEPLPEGRQEIGDTIIHLDGAERFHNLFGPAYQASAYEDDRETGSWVIHGERFSEETYPYAAASAAEAAGLLDDGPEDRNTKWLVQRREILAEFCEQAETGAFVVEIEPLMFEDDEPEGYLTPTKEEEGHGTFLLGRRLAALADMENVERIHQFADSYALDDGERRPSIIEAAIAAGFLKPDRVGADELADLTKGKNPPKGLAPRLRRLSPERALEVLPAVLRATLGKSGWDEVEAVVPKPGRPATLGGQPSAGSGRRAS